LQVQPPPQVIQVWLETGGTAATPAAPQPTPVLVIHGAMSFTPDGRQITWKVTDATDVILRAAQTVGARVLVRVHCWQLFDANNGIFSAAPDALLGFPTPKVPGGILESWFFLPRG
jgi:hypothetical protein